ncbi:DNA-binding response regulator, partial [bacterium]|nr:DNA-binding response regulator [bacterium]
MEPARILIIDDHPLVRSGICSLLELESDLEVCG